MNGRHPIRLDKHTVPKVIGFLLFAYLFVGFMLIPFFNTLASVFGVVNPDGSRDPLAVIRFFFAGNMGRFVLNSLKLAVCLVIDISAEKTAKRHIGYRYQQ